MDILFLISFLQVGCVGFGFMKIKTKVKPRLSEEKRLSKFTVDFFHYFEPKECTYEIKSMLDFVWKKKFRSIFLKEYFAIHSRSWLARGKQSFVYNFDLVLHLLLHIQLLIMLQFLKELHWIFEGALNHFSIKISLEANFIFLGIFATSKCRCRIVSKLSYVNVITIRKSLSSITA